MSKIKSILTLAVCLFTFKCNSQTFHGIIFTNTNDKTIGKSAKKNTQNIQVLMSNIATKLYFKADINAYYGNNYNYEKLDSVLKSLKTNSGDVVFFYLNGHGYKSSSFSNFPRVSIESISSRRFLVSTDTINARIITKSTKPQSILTVIQSCNRTKSSYHDLPLITQGLVDYSEENFKNLFLSGLNVMVTSSQRGKTSIATSKGSHFTLSFIKALSEVCQNETPTTVTWKGVLEKAKKYSLSLNRSRYPVWNIKPL